MPVRFENQIAIVTGAGRGIGRGIALKLAAEGVKIAVHYYRNEAAANATLAEIRTRGSDGFVVQADVCRPEEIAPAWLWTLTLRKRLPLRPILNQQDAPFAPHAGETILPQIGFARSVVFHCSRLRLNCQ